MQEANKESAAKRKRLQNDTKTAANASPDLSSSFTPTPRRNLSVTHLLNRPSSVVKPEAPEIDVAKVSTTLKSKNINPSTLSFGFLGLGIMGSGIVKNLINSGHKVCVWNRTANKVSVFFYFFLSNLFSMIFIHFNRISINLKNAIFWPL